MYDLYTWTTPNGRKVSILLEELGVDYTAHAIDIGKEEQFAPAFLPAGKLRSPLRFRDFRFTGHGYSRSVDLRPEGHN